MQKLKMSFFHLLESLFTCFLKDKTLHNHWDYAGFTVPYYNIPSNNRELQPRSEKWHPLPHYNIPSNNRELQPTLLASTSLLIITYQVITGNYSALGREFADYVIITYQVITGNYSYLSCLVHYFHIITYQVITGNYSLNVTSLSMEQIITYQVITGNYSVSLLYLLLVVL